MSNTITDLFPDIYAALDVVSRELTGLIPAVSRDSSVERAAKDQTIRIHQAPASTASDITPAVTPPNDGDQTIGNTTMTISKSRRVPFRWNGEESLSLNNGGVGVLSIQQDQIAQAIRTLVNEMETDLAAEHVNFSNAYGTAGTTPFGTAGDYSDASQALKLLKDNGAPLSDLHCVLDTAAGANLLGKQSRTDFQGDVSMLRQGVLLDHMGMSIRESAQIVTSTAGTGSSATTDNAGYSVGDTVITLAVAGTGTIVAGDVITFAGDTTKYVVASGDADVSNGGTITLAAPGLKVAIPASTTAITVVAAAARNMVFARNALMLATRAPALPDGGDMAVDRATITDPRSGLSFEIAQYAQYRQMQWEISAAWGTKTVKPEHAGLLLG
jgi:hypothetical protein